MQIGHLLFITHIEKLSIFLLWRIQEIVAICLCMRRISSLNFLQINQFLNIELSAYSGILIGDESLFFKIKQSGGTGSVETT